MVGQLGYFQLCSKNASVPQGLKAFWSVQVHMYCLVHLYMRIDVLTSIHESDVLGSSKYQYLTLKEKYPFDGSNGCGPNCGCSIWV